MKKVVYFLCALLIYSSFLFTSDQLTAPVFIPENILNSEFAEWGLSQETIDTLQSAEIQSREERGFVLWATNEEIEKMLRPKEMNALVSERETLSLDGNQITAITINFPNTQNSSVREDKAIKNILAKCLDCGITRDQVKTLVKFIEHDFFKFIVQDQYYLQSEVTGLPYDLEYDRETGLFFIHLKKFIGAGSVKSVTLSILYGIENPRVVATAIAKPGSDILFELAVVRELQHIDRVYHVIAITENQVGDKVENSIITTYYEGGELTQEKKSRFSFKEKVSLAKDLMEALKGAHEAGFVHEDIHDGNTLLEKNEDPKLTGVGQRLVLADWGKSFKVTHLSEYYKRKDVYAAGATLYSLFHNLGYEPTFFNKLNLFAARVKDPGNPNDLLLGEISPEMSARKAFLDNAYQSGALIRRERFERIILHMVHPTKEDARDAAYWYREFESLLSMY